MDISPRNRGPVIDILTALRPWINTLDFPELFALNKEGGSTYLGVDKINRLYSDVDLAVLVCTIIRVGYVRDFNVFAAGYGRANTGPPIDWARATSLFTWVIAEDLVKATTIVTRSNALASVFNSPLAASY